jgi:hypothetical protein
MSLHEFIPRSSSYITFQGNLQGVCCAVHEADPPRLRAVILLGTNGPKVKVYSFSCSIGLQPDVLSKLRRLVSRYWLYIGWQRLCQVWGGYGHAGQLCSAVCVGHKHAASKPYHTGILFHYLFWVTSST